MRTAALEYELEALPEFEMEYELEGEYESEEFFRQLAALARRAVQSPTMPSLAEWRVLRCTLCSNQPYLRHDPYRRKLGAILSLRADHPKANGKWKANLIPFGAFTRMP
jgi:hypothetical protein